MKSTMNWQLKVAFFCYVAIILLTGAFAIVYLYRGEFMPYHSEVVGQNWSEISPALQHVILGLMQAVGAAWLSLAIAASILLYKPFRRGERWSFWGIFFILLPAEIVNLWVVVNMSMNTAASPPWEIVAFKAVLLLVGFSLSIPSKDEVIAN